MRVLDKLSTHSERYNQQRDVWKDALSSSRLFIRLDFGYFIAAITLITAFKLTYLGLIDYYPLGPYALIAVILLLSIDSISENFIFNCLLEKQGMADFQKKLVIAKRWGNTQRVLHHMFIVGIFSYFLGFSSAVYEYKQYEDSKKIIQLSVDVFIAKEGRVPKDLGEIKGIKQCSNLVSYVSHKNFEIIKGKNKKYEILFFGKDQKAGTADDEVISDSDKKLYKE